MNDSQTFRTTFTEVVHSTIYIEKTSRIQGSLHTDILNFQVVSLPLQSVIPGRSKLAIVQ